MYPGFEEGALGVFGFAGFGLEAPLVNGALDLASTKAIPIGQTFCFKACLPLRPQRLFLEQLPNV